MQDTHTFVHSSIAAKMAATPPSPVNKKRKNKAVDEKQEGGSKKLRVEEGNNESSEKPDPPHFISLNEEDSVLDIPDMIDSEPGTTHPQFPSLEFHPDMHQSLSSAIHLNSMEAYLEKRRQEDLRLFLALVRSGQVEAVRRFLQCGSGRPDDLSHALWLASCINQWGVVQCLLEHADTSGIALSVREAPVPGTFFGLNPFVAACVAREWRVAEFMLLHAQKHKIQLSLDFPVEHALLSPFWYACRDRQWKVVRLMLEHGPVLDINMTPVSGPDQGLTPLWYACHFQQWDIVLSMLEYEVAVFVVAWLTKQKEEKKPLIPSEPLLDKCVKLHQPLGEEGIWHEYAFYFAGQNRDLLSLMSKYGPLGQPLDLHAAPLSGPHEGRSPLWYVCHHEMWHIALLMLQCAGRQSSALLDLNALIAVPDRLICALNPSLASSHPAPTGLPILWYACFHKRWDLVSSLFVYASERNLKLDLSSSLQCGQHANVTALQFALQHKQWELAAGMLELDSNPASTLPSLKNHPIQELLAAPFTVGKAKLLAHMIHPAVTPELPRETLEIQIERIVKEKDEGYLSCLKSCLERFRLAYGKPAPVLLNKWFWQAIEEKRFHIAECLLQYVDNSSVLCVSDSPVAVKQTIEFVGKLYQDGKNRQRLLDFFPVLRLWQETEEALACKTKEIQSLEGEKKELQHWRKIFGVLPTAEKSRAVHGPANKAVLKEQKKQPCIEETREKWGAGLEKIIQAASAGNLRLLKGRLAKHRVLKAVVRAADARCAEDLMVLRFLLQNEVGPNEIIGALWYACCAGRESLVQPILHYAQQHNMRLDFDRVPPSGPYAGRTMFWLACKGGQTEAALAILAYVRRQSQLRNLGVVPKSSDNAQAEQQNQPANPDAALELDEVGTTPLWWTCYHQQWEVVQSIFAYASTQPFRLDLNAAPIWGPHKGRTALWWAYRHQNWESVLLILKHAGVWGVSLDMEGAPIVRADGKEGVDAYFLSAFEHRQWEAVCFLLESLENQPERVASLLKVCSFSVLVSEPFGAAQAKIMERMAGYRIPLVHTAPELPSIDRGMCLAVRNGYFACLKRCIESFHAANRSIAVSDLHALFNEAIEARHFHLAAYLFQCCPTSHLPKMKMGQLAGFVEYLSYQHVQTFGVHDSPMQMPGEVRIVDAETPLPMNGIGDVIAGYMDLPIEYVPADAEQPAQESNWCAKTNMRAFSIEQFPPLRAWCDMRDRLAEKTREVCRGEEEREHYIQELEHLRTLARQQGFMAEERQQTRVDTSHAVSSSSSSSSSTSYGGAFFPVPASDREMVAPQPASTITGSFASNN